MCIIALAWQVFDHMPLMILSNRDEFFTRPTLPAHQWQDLPIFAGRDQLSNGTWLGYNSDTNKDLKRWATVLNFREQPSLETYQSSRGQLVTDFLISNVSPMQFAKQITLTDYAGFNLLIGDEKQAVFINNRGYPPTALHSGLHVISNGQPDDAWFKCERLRMRVSQELLPIISTHVISTTVNLNNQSTLIKDKKEKDYWQRIAFDILKDNMKAEELVVPDTGLPKEIEIALSAICISNETQSTQEPLVSDLLGSLVNDFLNSYGTRTQSILTLQQNSMQLLESNIM